MDADKRWAWSQFCGSNSSQLIIWDHKDFGFCFEKLVLTCPTHVILALASAHCLGRHLYRQIRGPIVYSSVLILRILITFLLVITAIISPMLTAWYLHVTVSMIDIVTSSTKAFAWCLHAVFLIKHQRFFHLSLRGPCLAIFAVLLTFTSTVIELRTVILNMLYHAHHVTVVQQYTTFVTLGLLSIYLLTLFPSRRPSLEHLTLNLQDERDSLISPLSQYTSYGSISDNITESLGVAASEANCFSRLFFWWVNPLMVCGAKDLINSVNDLFQLPLKLQTLEIGRKFHSVYSLENSHETTSHETVHNDDSIIPHVRIVTDPDDQNRSRRITLLAALHKCFGLEYYSIGILKLLADILGFAGPLLLNLLVSYVENSNETIWHGYLYAAGLFGSTLLMSFFSTHFNYLVQVVGLKMRAAIITTVYQKTLLTNSVAINSFSIGEVVNFMSTDTDRVVNFCPSFHAFWSLPFQIAISLYLLYLQVGLAFLAGLGFAVLLIPINRWLAVKIGQLSNDMMTQKDARVKVMNEILCGIRVIKFYAWESHFASRIDELRSAELRSLRGRKYLDALCVYFWATTPVLISILTFTSYSLMGNKLTAAKVFTSLALFNVLISPLNAFPWVVNGLMEAWVSIKRLQRFLLLPDLDLSQYYDEPYDLCAGDELVVKDGCFSWTLPSGSDHDDTSPPDHTSTCEQTEDEDNQQEEEEEDSGCPSHSKDGTLQLRNISFKIPKGSLVGVIGKVGAGKSSLLSALMAEMQLLSGHVTLRSLSSGFSLVAQDAWIQHATLRENILFGSIYETAWYRMVIKACALDDDLRILPAGDNTEIGENGVTLSGGQKARVALARAVYQNKRVYLLDDPLSAVDAHIAQHIFQECIMGLMCNKTRVLCTHHTSFLQRADIVIRLHDGVISQIGAPSEVLTEFEITGIGETGANNSMSNKTDSAHTPNKEDLVYGGAGDGNLVQEEEKESGAVQLSVYTSYWNAVGKCLAPAVLLSLLFMQASRNINDWWLSYWVTHSHHAEHHGDNSSAHTLLIPSSIPETSIPVMSYSYTPLEMSVGWTNVTEADDNVTFYLMVYGILAGSNSFLTLIRAFLFAYGGICAAQVIHVKLLASILSAPISFFDMTPIGRIVNRFSSDLYSVDDSLPFIMNILLAQFFGVLGTIIVTCYGLPWFALFLLPLGVVYYLIQQYYRKSSREIKRITSVTLSPIYAHFSETVTGLVTIRALRHTTRFQGENVLRLESNQRAQYAGIVASQWLGIRLQMMGVAMVTAVAFIAVLEHHFQTVNPGLVGLAISYALSITNLLNGVVTSFTETEKQMVSVERASDYIENVPHETEHSTLSVPSFWPIQGSITFQRVCLQYRPSLPPALRNVSFETEPAEKIGIVGRTGSGKSSLFLALFRIVEIQSGQMLIDGINLRHLDLRELRSRFAVIPQDPFLFSGSIRENLDPKKTYSSREIWMVLDRCHLRLHVERLGGLDAEVAERGRQFSAGQRQLLCLARAMLTRAKVICIDEATASVDRETDELLQKTISQEFSNHTVLTIAHRLNTILDSDRVLVMDKGSVVEFAPPSLLLERPNSKFYQLVHGMQHENDT